MKVKSTYFEGDNNYVCFVERERERDNFDIEYDMKWNYNGIVNASMQRFNSADDKMKF